MLTLQKLSEFDQCDVHLLFDRRQDNVTIGLDTL